MPNESQMTEAELDHIAAGIRPSWELDDAPFRPGGLASPELEALLAGSIGNGVSHSHTNGAAAAITAQRVVALSHEPEDMLTRVDPVPPAPVLEDAPIAPVRVEAAAPAPLPVPQFAAQAVAQVAVPPQSTRPPAAAAPPPSVQIASSHPPPSYSQNASPSRQGNGAAMSAQADPFAAPPQQSARPKAARAKATSSADFPAIKKSNKGLFIALGGGAVVIVIAAVAFTSGSAKTDATKVSASPTATQMPGTATTHEIPPPPATDDLPAATAAATQAAAPTATTTATQAADLPATTAAAVTPPPPATHVAHNDTPPPPATHHAASPPAHPNPPPSGGGGKGKGGIVRDVPF
jgi:hypothetical protein